MQFIDCTSVNISINRMGLRSVTFVIISDESSISIPTSIFGVTNGVISYVKQEPMVSTPKFLTTQVTLSS